MEAKTKNILIITGVILLIGGISVGIYFLTREDKPNDEDVDETQDESTDSESENTGNSEVPKPTSTTPKVVDPSMVYPKYNAENELSNDYAQIKGRMLYPKRKEVGGWGYTNVRESALVNNNTSWWTDNVDNLLTTINSGTPIGTVTGETAGVHNGYSYRWFIVKLYEPVGFWITTTKGYVRADTVTFKPYKK